MLQLVCLFCFQHPLWAGWRPRVPKAASGGLFWPPLGLPWPPLGVLLDPLGSRLAPYGVTNKFQKLPLGFQGSQRFPKALPRGCKRLPGGCHGFPEGFQGVFKGPSRLPRGCQNVSKGFQVVPKGFQGASKWHKVLPRWLFNGGISLPYCLGSRAGVILFFWDP